MVDLRQIIERGLGPGTYGSRGFNPWEDFEEMESGLLVPGHVIKKKRWPTAVDLFSGVGGFSLGLMRAGFKVVGGMGPQDALRKMLTQTSGAGAVISSKGKPVRPGKEKSVKKNQSKQEQMTLLPD